MCGRLSTSNIFLKFLKIKIVFNSLWTVPVNIREIKLNIYTIYWEEGR